MYLASNIFTDESVAIKINCNEELNNHEYDIMYDLKGINGFPKVLSKGLHRDQPYIVQEKLGLSLKDLLKLRKRHFSKVCIFNLGIKLIQ